MELVINTSTNLAGVALSDHGVVREEIIWRTEQNHTVELLPQVMRLLQTQRMNVNDLAAIVVARGPGSFNGLRVGLATAKGLAFALRIPLASISTLEAMAFVHAAQGLPICPVIRVGRSEIASALFQVQDGEWLRIEEERLTTAEELCAATTRRTILCGEIEGPFGEEPVSQLMIRPSLTEESAIPPVMSCLSQLGWRRILLGGGDDIRSVQPLYLRRPAITVPKKRRQDAMSYMWPRP